MVFHLSAIHCGWLEAHCLWNHFMAYDCTCRSPMDPDEPGSLHEPPVQCCTILNIEVSSLRRFSVLWSFSFTTWLALCHMMDICGWEDGEMGNHIPEKWGSVLRGILSYILFCFSLIGCNMVPFFFLKMQPLAQLEMEEIYLTSLSSSFDSDFCKDH